MSDAMSDNPLIQVAETIQTAHINRQPSPDHDVNPSTSASFKQPVEVRPANSLDELDADDLIRGAAIDEAHLNILRPAPRRAQMPPLPDLRFEQSYLASIKNAADWRSVALITINDQVIMPLLQGTLWTLMVCGFRHWNRASTLNGQSVGAKIRRWWWAVNNWETPGAGPRDEKYAEQIRESMLTWSKYYEAEFGSGGD